jgi:hypothetical protein
MRENMPEGLIIALYSKTREKNGVYVKREAYSSAFHSIFLSQKSAFTSSLVNYRVLGSSATCRILSKDEGQGLGG